MEMAEIMLSYEALITWASKELECAGVPDAKLDAWYLFSEAFQVSRARYFLDKNRKIALPKEQVERFQQWVETRKKRVPLQHILGTQEFMGYSFQVNEHVLIPRQDTELLVEEVLMWCQQQKQKNIIGMDMCTGSGCIAISLKLLCKNLIQKMIAVDLSEMALQTARENAKLLNADVAFVQSDLFENINSETKVDFLVSNPPYIEAHVIETLMPEVKDYEPRMALEAKEQGLYFYKILAREGFSYVKSGGIIYMEIGFDQANAVSALLKEHGWKQIQVKKDLAGLDRVVTAIHP